MYTTSSNAALTADNSLGKSNVYWKKGLKGHILPLQFTHGLRNILLFRTER